MSDKWTEEDIQIIITKLATLLWNEKYTLKVADLFSPLLLEILARASNFSDVDFASSYAKHEWMCICLSKLIWHYPEVGRFARMYFEKTRNLFWRYEGDGHPPPQKKTKTDAVTPPTYLLLKAAYLFLVYDTSYFRSAWPWNVIVQFFKSDDIRERWYAFQCLGRIVNIKDSVLQGAIGVNFSPKELTLLKKEAYELGTIWNQNSYNPMRRELCNTNQVENTICDKVTETVNIWGILLNKNQDMEPRTSSDIVPVPSTKEALYSLSLAIATSEPVLLQGPVGCGKTSLIQHLAEVTGKTTDENFLKVQLGDHVDGKMLIGSHICTDIPGQFVWKPGVLINAMTQGHWLLLEDIDCAPMDVASLLVPVLQSRSILISGQLNPIKAAPGFQLFATQRLLSGFGGSYLEFRNNAEVVDKLWRKVMVSPLSKSELTEVISAKWPKLIPIISRILSVYSLFSADLREIWGNSNGQEPFNSFCKNGRFISMRDLFKFCSRIEENFDPANGEKTAIICLKNAIACFCDSIPDPETRILAAESICVHFNLPKVKAEFFYKNYKPNIDYGDQIIIGTVCLPRRPREFSFERVQKSVFAPTRLSLSLLEKVAACVYHKEPVLLVGETGTGKTSIVQQLAELTNQKLTVVNMSQQSDSVDLIGGYKPIDFTLALKPIKNEFDNLFPMSLDVKKNSKFLQHVSDCFQRRTFRKMFAVMLHAQKNIVDLFLNKHVSSGKHLEMVGRWKKLGEKIKHLENQMKQSKPSIMFHFLEGALIQAMQKGEWLLLDEINLAEAETLECLVAVLEKDESMIILEKSDNESVKRHPNFRIFACMNPATDIGKKDLPTGIRSRFSEFFVEETDNPADLSVLVHEYLRGLPVNNILTENIVKFYQRIKEAAAKQLNDGSGYHPHYSLRTLCRALRYASTNPCHNIHRSLYEAFCLSFLSQLDNKSHEIVIQILKKQMFAKISPTLYQDIPEPRTGKYVQVSGYWILQGQEEPHEPENYIFTETVERNIHDLARIVSAGRFPVLLQGETSSGKTSLIQYLAKITGNVCLRVNNHEHTDIQEYIGTYGADDSGNLVFREGILVEAMRNGYWIILDELNLAPTEVMEALNRVLDDNRELYISETQKTVKAKQGFMVFATQNPPGHYGGRKILSRAFRNRFIELHFNDIPPPELEVILAQRCKIPPSYSKKLVAVMYDLQMRRRESGVFAGKQGFITLRDLFRWGERYQYALEPSLEKHEWHQLLADEGYLLLACRVRCNEEILIIQEVLEKHFKKKTDPGKLFNLSDDTSRATKHILESILQSSLSKAFQNIVWTQNIRRLAVLVGKAIQFKEPVLLIGNTGCGKTTICQIFAELSRKKLYSVNCHMHSESADFVGGLRPVRTPRKKDSKLFEWVDGPLIKAMIGGHYFLCDEISLADDSVLERLNSILEPEQKILLTEKCLDEEMNMEITAKEGFQFFATMNPGGDFGKKELSPALRNRFTEIWCPNNMSSKSDIIEIVDYNIRKELCFLKNIKGETFQLGVAIAEFFSLYSTLFGRLASLSLRDVLNWVEFINTTANKIMSPIEALLHGAFLVCLDHIGTGSTATNFSDGFMELKEKCFRFLAQQIIGLSEIEIVNFFTPEITKAFQELPIGICKESKTFGIGPFQIKLGDNLDENSGLSENYVFRSKTTKINVMRILRALHLPKPILLEGSPGVGKTSLVESIAKASGHNVVRINLSEQTDISDLFGADLPVEGGKPGEFSWRNGPILQAVDHGDWILLDELNLASQSVLEGLNACFDHRSEIHIPETGQVINCDKSKIKIFGCQNPHQQGGSRKGLPRSFLNRFTQVYIKPMNAEDYLFITTNLFPEIPNHLLIVMIKFNAEIERKVNVEKLFGHSGSPFAFNLRDIFRWCEAMSVFQCDGEFNIGEFVKLIYADRMRTAEDKRMVFEIYDRLVKDMELSRKHFVVNRPLELSVYEDSIHLGHSAIERGTKNLASSAMTSLAPGQFSVLESLMKCIEMNWVPILVGPSGSGKTSMVRMLAELAGHRLHILSINSEMDTMDLLGGFEQVCLFKFLLKG
ncbi:midasin [Trichonephila clavata]|uniref:Midasin n=1 Tax=Trichonephila clavata TaxID=2740835 RepID=A0A8X6LDZ6_TRICU|nr:midasin [Trichonephila clavata]